MWSEKCLGPYAQGIFLNNIFGYFTPTIKHRIMWAFRPNVRYILDLHNILQKLLVKCPKGFQRWCCHFGSPTESKVVQYFLYNAHSSSRTISLSLTHSHFFSFLCPLFSTSQKRAGQDYSPGLCLPTAADALSPSLQTEGGEKVT